MCEHTLLFFPAVMSADVGSFISKSSPTELHPGRVAPDCNSTVNEVGRAAISFWNGNRDGLHYNTLICGGDNGSHGIRARDNGANGGKAARRA